jgi:hypothetical protein
MLPISCVLWLNTFPPLDTRRFHGLLLGGEVDGFAIFIANSAPEATGIKLTVPNITPGTIK